MTPDISIIFPHLRQDANDKALQIALSCIVDNTALDYELMIESVAERRDIYGVLNNMARRAKSEWIVFSNSDVFFAPGWGEPMYEAREVNTIVTGIICECGAIGVADVNWHIDFGMTPQTFRRAEFEEWVEAEGQRAYDTKRIHERGWYFPCLLNRDEFLKQGGFDTTRGIFPEEPLDIFFWDNWAATGHGFKRVKSFCFHLQFYSSEFEQNKAVRLG